MKLNKIFMALAAMAIVGCSSDDLNVSAPQQVAEDSRLVELGSNFALAGVGVEDNGTRTHWEQLADKSLVNKFLPIYNDKAIATATLETGANLEAQAVGLCWLGNGAVGTDVYTNYQFYHFGWLNNDETKANIECNKLTNGAFYSDLELAAAGTDGAEADPTNFKYTAASGKTGTVKDDLNFNSGVYKTDNKAIFGGKYIVYYPFNDDFKDAGTIPVIAETTFGNGTTTTVSTTFNTPELGKATFRYSSPVTIEGGAKASDFGLYNLSSLVQLRVATPAGVTISGAKIDQIVLWSKKEQLLKQANLAADKIVAGQKGAGLYADTEGTKTIVANFTTGTGVALLATNAAPTSAYITVLPTTVEDLVAFVHRCDAGNEGWATISLGKTEFEAGKAKRLDIPVTAADFKADYIAVDEASLTTALTEARAAVTADPTARPKIRVIGDITLGAATYNINAANDAVITITGDDIIVPQNVTLNLLTNMESKVRVLGKSCCTGTAGGILDIQGGTVSNVTMEETEANAKTPVNNPTVKYTGSATVAAGKTFDAQAGNVIVNAAVSHKGNFNVGEDAIVTVNATGGLNFMGATVVNDGTIEVKKDGKFDMTDANGNATASDGQRMTNNGKFIHNVDAGVGTAVQKMNQNGEYRCKVDQQIKLDDAFKQWTACSVIEMVNAGAYSYNLATYGAADATTLEIKHNNKYIDFEVTGGGVTTFNNPAVALKGDNKVIKIGNLTVAATAGGLNIDFIEGSAANNFGQRTLTVNGDMTVAAPTEIKGSKKINITENLIVNGATLKYYGGKAWSAILKNNEGLAVTKDITVTDGIFDASDDDALNITSANFYLKKVAGGSTATFGNRTDGGAQNLVVGGTISNPKGCTFDILPASGGSNVLAWVTCKKLEIGGTFPHSQPRVD